MTESNDARAAHAPDADEREAATLAAVLNVWNARSDWPAGWPPTHAADMARLLDEIPDIDNPNVWLPRSLLGQFHTIHLHILSTLIDLATLPRAVPQDQDTQDFQDAQDAIDSSSSADTREDGQGPPRPDRRVDQAHSLEVGWLEQFGERLTPDESTLLRRVASRPRRLDALTNLVYDTQPAAPSSDPEPDLPSSEEDAPRSLDVTDPDATHGESESDNGSVWEIRAEDHPLILLVDSYRQVLVDILNGPEPADEEPHDGTRREADEF